MSSSRGNQRSFERWTVNQRIQHITLILSFTTLVVTGLPLRYSELRISETVVKLMGGITMRGHLHRAAALVLILLSIYHLGYIVFSQRGRREFMAIMPKFQDVKDSIGMLLLYLGFSNQKPRFGKYNFIEKFEYFALAWGSVIMIVTGAVLWFVNDAMKILPKWAIDIAQIVHSYEALLAFLAILIWHFYHVHLNPEVFPMSWTWLNGKVSENELREHRPLEYERLLAKQCGTNNEDVA